MNPIEARSYLERSLPILVDKSLVDTLVEYLSSFDVVTSSSQVIDLKLYLIELCGKEKIADINAFVDGYCSYMRRNEPVSVLESLKDLSLSLNSTSPTIPSASTSTKSFGNPINLPSAKKVTSLDISNIGKKKLSKNKALLGGKDASTTRAKCGCLSTRHPFIGSCLSCGYLACEVEGPLTSKGFSCLFCDGMILPPLSAEDILTRPELANEATIKAYQLKDRLLVFDKEHAKRTHVHDAQADYYESSTWLTEEEKKAIDEKEKRREKYLPSNRRIRVAYDIASRFASSSLIFDSSMNIVCIGN